MSEPIGFGSYVVYVQFIKGQPEAAIKGATDDMNRAKKPVQDSGRKLGQTWKSAFAASIAVGAVLANEVNKLQSGFNQIRNITGATGQSLDSLRQTALGVFSTVPNSFEQVGTVVGELNTRLGQTGERLEKTAKSVIDLSDVTGTDATNNVRDITRLINDWGLQAEDTTSVLDKLFRATQGSGVSLDTLSANVTKAGATLRGFGFSFDQAITLAAAFEREGVNTEQVLAAMKIGLRNAAKEGEPLAGAFFRITEEIKNASTETEAMNIAIAAFGGRAGSELVDVVRNGRLEFGQLFNTIVNGTDTIAAADQETDTFIENLMTVKNRLTTAVTPALNAFGETLKFATGWLADVNPVALIAVTAVAGIALAFNNLKVKIDAAKSSFAQFRQSAIGKAGTYTAIAAAISVIVTELIQWRAESQKLAGQNLQGQLEGTVEELGQAAEVSEALDRPVGVLSDSLVQIAGDVQYLNENWSELNELQRASELSTLDPRRAFKGFTMLFSDGVQTQARLEQALTNIDEYDQRIVQAIDSNAALGEVIFNQSVKALQEMGLTLEQVNAVLDDSKKKLENNSEIQQLRAQRIDFTVKREEALIKVEEEFGRKLEDNTTLMQRWSETLSLAFNPIKSLMDAEEAVLEANYELLDLKQQLRNLETEQFDEGKPIDFIREGESLFEAENRRNEEYAEREKRRAEFNEDIASRRQQIERQIADVNRGTIDRALNVINSQKQLASVLAPLVAAGKSEREALDIVIGELRAAGVSEEEITAFTNLAVPLLENAKAAAAEFNQEMANQTAAMNARIDEEVAIGQRKQDEFTKEMEGLRAIAYTQTENTWLEQSGLAEKYGPEIAGIVFDSMKAEMEELVATAARSRDSENGYEITETEESVLRALRRGEISPRDASAWMRQLGILASRRGGLQPDVAGRYSGASRSQIEALLGTNDPFAYQNDPNWRPRALGGNVNPSRMYMVGERGPELFVPSQSGYIMSNKDLVNGMAGGGGITNVFQTRELSAAQLADEVSFRQARQLKGRQR